jgi:hypothetical protein
MWTLGNTMRQRRRALHVSSKTEKVRFYLWGVGTHALLFSLLGLPDVQS